MSHYTKKVREFIRGDWTEADGSAITEARAIELTEKHGSKVGIGWRCASAPSYVADEIARAEGNLIETCALTTKLEAEAAERET